VREIGLEMLAFEVIRIAAGRGAVEEVAGEEAAAGEDAVLADVAVVCAQPAKVSAAA
jgi:hypothetical protein